MKGLCESQRDQPEGGKGALFGEAAGRMTASGESCGGGVAVETQWSWVICAPPPNTEEGPEGCSASVRFR